MTEAGLPKVPQDFSVVSQAQLIPKTTLDEIDQFIRLYDRVTTSTTWRQVVSAAAPLIARDPHPEVSFFTAWDFHLSPEQGWQLIECNDNGSGFFYASLINHFFYQLAEFAFNGSIVAPESVEAFKERLIRMVKSEAINFFGTLPDGLFLILEAEEVLRRGKFHQELVMLEELLVQLGLNAAIASPNELHWDGKHLSRHRQTVAFVINRCTDFFWDAEEFCELRAAYGERKVYIAPNPFTYATRSDKRLLEFLSRPDWDRDLGIGLQDRAMLSAHVPVTYLLREENINEVTAEKENFIFKPAHGFAGHGVLTSSQVGRGRLRQLLKKGVHYVAQKKVPKAELVFELAGAKTTLWTDLRVWAYQGERYLVSGRGSTQSDVLNFTPPGGWLPTLVTR